MSDRWATDEGAAGRPHSGRIRPAAGTACSRACAHHLAVPSRSACLCSYTEAVRQYRQLLAHSAEDEGHLAEPRVEVLARLADIQVRLQALPCPAL